MKHEVAEKWIEALKSKEYKQGKNKLCRVDGGDREYCCLGVLCDVYSKEHPSSVFEPSVVSSDWLTFFGCSNTLPDEVRIWSGMATATGDYLQHTNNLVRMNDIGTPFWKIAKIIDQFKDEL